METYRNPSAFFDCAYLSDLSQDLSRDFTTRRAKRRRFTWTVSHRYFVDSQFNHKFQLPRCLLLLWSIALSIAQFVRQVTTPFLCCCFILIAMRDTLLSQFRGAFLGALIGESIGTSQLNQRPSGAWHKAEHSRLQPVPAASQSHCHSRLMFAQTEVLLQAVLGASTPVRQRVEASVQSEVQPSNAMSSPTQMAALAIATIPIALFYHDQPATLHQALQAALQPVAVSSESLFGVTVVGQTLSLLLREQQVPQQLIPQLIADLDLPDSPLVHQLRQVQTWIEQPVELTAISRWVKVLTATSPETLDSLPIALGLYSFLSTPEDFRLSLSRLAQLFVDQLTPGAEQAVLACTLAGTVSGLYNGWIGIPLTWRQLLWRSPVSKFTQRWGSVSESDLLQYADQLLAAWSGVAHPTDWEQQPQFTSITAAPRVIRST